MHMSARQCPRCELRFLSDVEVRDHLILEHGMEPESLEMPYPTHGRKGPRSGKARRSAKPARDDASDPSSDGSRRRPRHPDKGA
jgi:hypothetical protein